MPPTSSKQISKVNLIRLAWAVIRTLNVRCPVHGPRGRISSSCDACKRYSLFHQACAALREDYTDHIDPPADSSTPTPIEETSDAEVQ